MMTIPNPPYNYLSRKVSTESHGTKKELGNVVVGGQALAYSCGYFCYCTR
jgi:hypothetical protein